MKSIIEDVVRKTKNNEKANKGVTLVALVITVIILIILAGITIAGLTGEKGLIKEAKTAKELTELAGLEEQIDLAIIKAEQKHRNPTIDDVIAELINNKVISDESKVDKETGAIHTDAGYLIEGKLDDYIGKTSTGDGNTTGNNTTGGNTSSGGTTEEPTLPSTTNTQPFLPTGATQVEGTNLDTGLVIKDEKDNEWVWIEVPKSIYDKTTKASDYEAIETAMKNYAKDYRDETRYADKFFDNSAVQTGILNEEEYNNLKMTMLKSVFENGGFYIGKYETGTRTARISSSETLTTPIIQQDFYPYNYVTCIQAQTLAKQLTTGGKISSLMFGIQWDLILKYIEEKGAKTQEELKASTTWANTYYSTFPVNRGYHTGNSNTKWDEVKDYTKPNSQSILLSTGATERNSALQIYDLAGNVWEWTLEFYTISNNSSISRGYSYNTIGSGYSAEKRSVDTGTNSSINLGFRVALW